MYLLVAAGIDPVTHVRVQHDAEVEDHQPDENDNNKVVIEEVNENYSDIENNLNNQVDMTE